MISQVCELSLSYLRGQAMWGERCLASPQLVQPNQLRSQIRELGSHLGNSGPSIQRILGLLAEEGAFWQSLALGLQ